jgi:hypothetical protein
MLQTLELEKLARKLVKTRMKEVRLDDVVAENITSSTGEAALRITLIITQETADAITGEDALKLLVEINDSLQREGDERLAIIEYATADDVPIEEDEID